MEQFVLGIFQEQLSRFIVGFRKEQVNANLLNGKGEISNVELNCAVVNETISKITPYVELERVHVSKLSFHVSSWTNLRKAPISIEVEHVHAVAVEPLHYSGNKTRKRIQQIMDSQLLQMIQDGVLPRSTANRGPYNIFDRILDNLTIEIQTVTLDYQPWGKFKTRRAGPWTPPQLQVKLAGIRLASVNEYGQEAPPDEVWRHNHHHKKHGHHKTLLIYKRLVMEYQLLLRPVGDGGGAEKNSKAIPLVSGQDNKVEVQFAVQRRVRDGEWLAVQVDATIPRLVVDIPAHVVPLLAQTVAAVTFCLAKDRAFEDPLKANSSWSGGDNDGTANQAVQVTVNTTESFDVSEGGDASEVVVAAAADATSSEIPDELREESSSSSDDDDEVVSLPGDTSSQQLTPPATPSRASSVVSSVDYPDKPVILLPNGMVIHEKICVSVSVHHATVRGTYASDGHVEMEAKGCITELIWPKVTKDKGGYVQTSVAYMSIHEQNGSKMRPLVIGGVQYDASGPLEQPGTPLREVGQDETFPMYEDRSVRPDPVGLRHSFPAQAFGAKTTVDFNNEDDNENIIFLNEIGIDQFEVVADVFAWGRIARFAVNAEGGGFDPRWYSGDWGSELTQGMLLRPSEPLKLQDHMQTVEDVFLDDDYFVSSDRFNVTARLTRVGMRIPAALKEDLRSCDIVTNLGEAMLMVSSALPRTFLSGNIGASGKNETVDFPNDPSDVLTRLLGSPEDSSDQPNSISTFRIQLTLRGYSVLLEPVIPFNVGDEPRQLVAPSDLTTLLCFEGENSQNNEMKMRLIVSALVHRFDSNLDLDLLSAAIGTVTYHASSFLCVSKECAEILFGGEGIVGDMSERTEDGSIDGRYRSSLRGRKALLKRQLYRSRDTGGLCVAFALQAVESRFCLWRQNVPSRGPFKALSGDDAEGNKGQIAMLKVCTCDVMGLEATAEATLQEDSRRILVKLCLSSSNLEIVDMTAAGTTGKSADSNPLVDVARLGNRGNGNLPTNVVEFRAEEQLDSASRTWAFALDVRDGELIFRLRELEDSVLLVLEALLMPTSAKNHLAVDSAPREPFPAGSVGALLQSLVRFDPSDIIGGNVADSIAAVLDQAEKDIVSGELRPGKVLDTVLRRFIKKFAPENAALAALRITTANTIVRVPGSIDSKDFGCLFHSVDFLASYLFRDLGPCGLLDVVSRSGKKWSAVLESHGTGLWHGLDSRQSLLLMTPTEGEGSLARETVVDEFAYGYKYGSSTLSFSMAEAPAVRNVEKLEELLACLVGFALRCKQSVASMTSVVAAFRNSLRGEDSNEAKDVSRENPVSLAYSSTGDLMRSVVVQMRTLSGRVDEYGESMQDFVQSRQKEIDQLKMLVFAKERARLGALGLVSASIAGWLRLGAAQRTGQRGLLSCTLWPQWLVLRRCVLIVYNGPGTCEPIYVISLEGASLRQLAGGGRKRDLKRAFGLVDRAGTYYFLISGSDRDYYNWVRQLQDAIKVCSPNDPAEADDVSESQHSESLDRSRHSVTDSILNPSRHGRPLGQSISRAVTAAKATGRAVVDRRRRKNGEPSQPELLSTDASDLPVSTMDDSDRTEDDNGAPTPHRGKQLRTRFAGVGQATKSRFGNAFQNARQKGKDVAERRRNPLDRVDQVTGTKAETIAADSVPKKGDGSEEIRTDADTPASDWSSVSGSHTEEDGGAGRRVRERLGTAVRHVRRVARNAAEDDPQSETGKNRFSLRLRGPTERPDIVGVSMGEADVVKLRNVSVAGPLERPDNPIGPTPDEPDIPLKKLEGHWFVKATESLSGEESSLPVGDGRGLSSSFRAEHPAGTGEALTEGDSYLEPVEDDADPPIAFQNDDDGDEGDEQQMQAGVPPVISPVPKVVFEIEVFRQKEEEAGGLVTSKLEKCVPDILALHTAISESVARLTSSPVFSSNRARTRSSDMSKSLASALGLNAVETTRLTGNMLGGLVATGMSDSSDRSTGRGAHMVAEFLNSMLDCPLPIDGLASLTDFLEISNVSTKDVREDSTERAMGEKSSEAACESELRSEIHSLLASCETGVRRAERQNYIAEKLTIATFSSCDIAENPSSHFTTPSPSIFRYQDAMHSALLRVMEERDEAHSNMVAADVLHVQEMREQRKRADKLSLQLATKKNPDDKTPATTSEQKGTSTLMQQNSDEELVALCQQLATEISGRTSASMELTRLKEARQTERDCEANEKKELLAEIENLKQQLAQEKKKTEEALRESGAWKESFHEVVQAKGDPSPDLPDRNNNGQPFL